MNAVLLAAVSAVLYAAAAVVQERTAATGRSGAAGLLKNRAWWLSALLSLLGGLVHIGALRFGPLTLVQALGALTLVAAPLMSALLTGRSMTGGQWTGVALTTGGLAVLTQLTSSGGPRHVLGTTGLCTVAAVSALALALTVLAAVTAVLPAGAALWYATAAGVSFGASSTLAQTATLALFGAHGRIRGPVLVLTGLAVLGLSALGLALSQSAYRGGLDAPLALVTLVNPAFTAVIGTGVLGERYVTGPASAVLALAAVAAMCRGVVVLARRSALAAGPRGRVTVRRVPGGGAGDVGDVAQAARDVREAGDRGERRSSYS